MKQNLRKYFTDVGAKYLTKVDVGKQHEIGSNNFTSILGDPKDKKIPYKSTLLYLDDETDFSARVNCDLTWYDTRLEQKHRSSEFRLYYKTNIVSERMKQGDFCVVALKSDRSLLVIFTPPQSTMERQVRWLFGISDLPARGFSLDEVDDRRISIAEATILEELGVEVRRDDENWLDRIVGQFGGVFPNTMLFSNFARQTCPDSFSPIVEPDAALMAWIEHEEMLFRTLERQIVQRQLDIGFESVDHFIKFSLSVQNRRKSRIGYALEHHLAEIFSARKLPFGRQVVTENRSTVDFVFPGQNEYSDFDYPDSKLIMLAAKSTCKDRWRQVLVEAARIKSKHLLTLEPAISPHQTNEMKAHGLQLVVPRALKATYTLNQQRWVLDFESYLDICEALLTEF
ncbi:type II restriction endonuclease [Pseudomonas neuropathica]|uniref:type II restriction endonuclease n=1 Tax=Pseudomonas neuropathica TaxID=2730425 RepID=UPI003EB9E147